MNAIQAVVERHGEHLAAILVEPVAGNMGVVPPEPGFLERSAPRATRRAPCSSSTRSSPLSRRSRRRTSSLRGRAGSHGAGKDRRWWPLAAFGGESGRDGALGLVGAVYQAGTPSGSPLATAAGLSVLRRLRDPAVYEELECRSAALAEGLAPSAACSASEMLTLFCRDARSATSPTPPPATRALRALPSLLERGVFVAPSQFECLFVSLAHGEDEIERTIDAVRSHFD